MVGIERKKERTRVKKTINISIDWDETIREYARRTGLSQGVVIETLMSFGDREFRERYNLGEESDQSEEGKERSRGREEAARLQRERRERDWQEARKKRLRKKILGYENVDERDWTRQ